MPRCSCDPRSRMTASAAEAPLLGQHIPVAAFSRGAGVLGIAPPAPKSNVSMRPQPTQSSKTMRTPITATHSRPVQYSQNHAYRQEAPTCLPPIPSSPRGRGLVEPYRPLGPLPPRTVRTAARLGPHPVADGHLVDAAALAAPPCELAAYGLHAGGLQALVHTRVPHGRYAGMRGGQVVVAGEHLAPRAVRTARIRLALARSVHYEAGPLVALCTSTRRACWSWRSRRSASGRRCAPCSTPSRSWDASSSDRCSLSAPCGRRSRGNRGRRRRSCCRRISAMRAHARISTRPSSRCRRRCRRASGRRCAPNPTRPEARDAGSRGR